jgi:hypothetical protein
VSEALDIVNDVLQAINHPELLDPGKVLDWFNSSHSLTPCARY